MHYVAVGKRNLRMNKNITLSINEDLLNRARVIAALKRTSVNEMVREYLQHVVDRERDGDTLSEALLNLARQSKARLGEYRPCSEDKFIDR